MIPVRLNWRTGQYKNNAVMYKSQESRDCRLLGILLWSYFYTESSVQSVVVFYCVLDQFHFIVSMCSLSARFCAVHTVRIQQIIIRPLSVTLWRRDKT